MIRDFLKPVAHLARSALGTNGTAVRLAAMDAKLDQLSQGRAGPASPVPVPAAARIDPNLQLHQMRTAMLRAMPPGARRLLSAGCAGRWYFDWIEQAYGHVPEHIGIEFYSPRPDDLPGNVSWIANTASDMNAVASDSCDLVFSGQNIEHLWAHEVAGFLLEAARVLREGGHLVMDSPNRELTRLLNWSHPEHTIELTVPEARRLMELAGFVTTKQAGLWLCRDPRTGRLLPFDPNVADGDWSMAERLMAAQDRPEHAFVWWLEGRRNGAAPDRAGIEALLAAVYQHAWPERLRRMSVPDGRRIDQRGDGEWVVVAPGEAGLVLHGPNTPLRAGHHRVVFDIEPDRGSDGTIAVCDLCVGAEARVLGECEVTGGTRQVMLEVDLPAQEFGGQFRCRSIAGGFAIRRAVTLSEALA